MKLWPHESSTEMIVAAKRAHFIGPFTTKSPNMNSSIIIAPT